MHLATGDIPVVRSKIPADDRGVDKTVALMVKMARGPYGGKSAKIRALAINIINQAGVRDKDYYGMAEAIHNWVRDEIRYIRDPIGQETLSYPEETAFNTKAGDCDDKTILEMALLASLGIHSYPVVISTHPSGTFSHVYLHVIIPDGTHRRAGEIIPADPIMRQWPFGREAGEERVTRKKLYRHLIKEGTVMKRMSDDGFEGLGAYASANAHLDEENSADVNRALASQITFTAPDPGNTAIRRDADELVDTIFQPMEANRILARGPVTATGVRTKIRRIETKHKSFKSSDDLNFRPSISLLTPQQLQRQQDAQTIIAVAQRVMRQNSANPTIESLRKTPLVESLAKRQARRAARIAEVTQDPREAAFAAKLAQAAQSIEAQRQAIDRTPMGMEMVPSITGLGVIGEEAAEFFTGLGRRPVRTERPLRAQVEATLNKLVAEFDRLLTQPMNEAEVEEIMSRLGITVAPKYLVIRDTPNGYRAFGVNNLELVDPAAVRREAMQGRVQDRRRRPPPVAFAFRNHLIIPFQNYTAIRTIFNYITRSDLVHRL